MTNFVELSKSLPVLQYVHPEWLIFHVVVFQVELHPGRVPSMPHPLLSNAQDAYS